MSHTIFKTEALVLGTETVGEQSALVTFLTRDHGLLRARAQNGRGIESKHRPFLARFSRVTVDLVLGAGGWRVTGVHERARMRFHHLSVFPVFLRGAKLIEKLLGEGDPADPLFTFFDGMFDTPFLETLSDTERKGFEIYFVIELLSHLGYWERDAGRSGDPAYFTELAASSLKYVSSINEVLRTTHLMS